MFGIYATSMWAHFIPPYTKGIDEPVPYEVLADNGISHVIEIGVDANVSRSQLCATMNNVADTNQDDPAREYWIGEDLIVRAYLVRDGRKSYFKAGTLYRYIPVKHPVTEKEDRPDRFYTSVWLARLSL